MSNASLSCKHDLSLLLKRTATSPFLNLNIIHRRQRLTVFKKPPEVFWPEQHNRWPELSQTLFRFTSPVLMRWENDCLSLMLISFTSTGYAFECFTTVFQWVWKSVDHVHTARWPFAEIWPINLATSENYCCIFHWWATRKHFSYVERAANDFWLLATAIDLKFLPNLS